MFNNSMKILEENSMSDSLITEVVEHLTNGYSVEALCAAFEKVHNKDHWKNPIHARCCSEDIMVIAEAIDFYTATRPTFTYDPKSAKDPLPFVVVADGYWNGPAG